MDKIKAYDIFVKVADSGSFTRAAEICNLPRSTVSTVISQLETDLNVRLLQRTTRKLSLTAEGRQLQERARQLLNEVEEIAHLFIGSNGALQGKIKIDVPSRIASRIITPALPGFFKRYPSLELEIGATDRAINLIENSVDCVIRVGRLSESGLVARSLGEFAMINCASPAYLAEFGMPQTPQDLISHRVVQYASSSTGRIAPWEYQEGKSLRTLELNGNVTVNQAESYIACALAGLGLIQVPAYDVKQHIKAGELLPVLSDWRAPSMPVTALRVHRRQQPQRVHIFIDWMAELMQTQFAGFDHSV